MNASSCVAADATCGCLVYRVLLAFLVLMDGAFGQGDGESFKARCSWDCEALLQFCWGGSRQSMASISSGRERALQFRKAQWKSESTMMACITDKR